MNIQIHNLRKAFEDKIAVDVSDFSIDNGELLGLVGNNGAGKTTLFRLMLDLLKADEGSVELTPTHASHSNQEERGDSPVLSPINPAKSEEWKSMTGAYIDEGFLIDFLTPEEYFQFIGKISGMDQKAVDERLKYFEHLMAGEILGQKKLIRDYSAGNKQKIGIIAAMLNSPQLVILDEPFNFLDPSSQNVLKNMLTEYNQQTNATILVSSHNLAHTIDICPRIALLEKGIIIRDLDNRQGNAKKELEEYFNM